LVLVDDTAEDSPSLNRCVDRDDDDGRIVIWGMLNEALVRTMPVEVGSVLVEDHARVAFVVDQDPVDALLADATDEPNAK
jgi:hypothetical protein